jgi:hypothetical protein
MAKKFLTFFTAIIVVTAAPAFADTISQTQSFSGLPNINGSLSFNQFDNNSGSWILQAIQISFALQSIGGYVRLDNDSALPALGTLEFGNKGNISSTDVLLLASSLQPVIGQIKACHQESFSLAPDNGDGPYNYDWAFPDGLLYSGGIETNTGSGFVDSTFWAGYIGPGSYNINYSVVQWLNYSGFGGIEYAVTPADAAGEVTVIYTYSVLSVPEPATIGLLAIGSFAFIRKKR